MAKRKHFVLLAAAVSSAVALSGAPSMAAEGDCRVIQPATETTAEISVCRDDVFFKPGGSSPLANVDARAGILPTWATDAPTGSTATRYGSIRPVDMMQSSTAVRPTFTGTYTGVLDNLAIDMFLSSPVYQATGTAMSTYNQLIIDDVVVWENATSDDPEIDIPITAVNDTVGRISYAFTDLHAALKAAGVENESTTEHTITFSVTNKYWGDGNFMTHFGAADRASGMIINLEPNSRGRLPQYTELDTN